VGRADRRHRLRSQDARTAGIRVYRSHLHPHDVTRRDNIPVTSPARTLLDLAATLPQRDLDRITEEAQVQRRVTTRSLNEQFKRYPHHRGTAALRKAIRSDPALTRSEAERRLLELIRAARLDGYAFHSSRSSFERDRRRDRDLQAAGYRVLRITWLELTDGRDALIAELAAALIRPAAALR
jgi:hypothetical protein